MALVVVESHELTQTTGAYEMQSQSLLRAVRKDSPDFSEIQSISLALEILDLTPHLPLCIIGGPTTTCIVMVTTGMVNPHLKSGSTYKHMHKTEVVLLKTPPHFHLRNLSLTTGICLVDINYVVRGYAVLQLLPNGELTYPVLQQTVLYSISRLGLGLGLRLACLG